MQDLTAFQCDQQVTISGPELPKGLEINEYVEGYSDLGIRHGRLFPDQNTLAEMGFVNKGQHDQRTNKYELTDRGRRKLKARRQWEDNTPGDARTDVVAIQEAPPRA